MKLQVHERIETTMPHHSQIVCRRTNTDEWVLDIDKLAIWATDESIEGLAAQVIQGIVAAVGHDAVEVMVAAAVARVYREAS